MTRRSIPQNKIDDAAFPVRVLVRVPEGGLKAHEVHRWLDKTLGRTNYANHGGGRYGAKQSTTYYFRHPDHASQMLAASPDLLKLADGTTESIYSSPYLPFGRAPDEEDRAVCNLYSLTRTQDAVRHFFDDIKMADRLGNLGAAQYYPDQMAPIIRTAAGSLTLIEAPV
jgi:hypothetical protein